MCKEYFLKNNLKTIFETNLIELKGLPPTEFGHMLPAFVE